jgi:hypothetical protein
MLTGAEGGLSILPGLGQGLGGGGGQARGLPSVDQG